MEKDDILEESLRRVIAERSHGGDGTCALALTLEEDEATKKRESESRLTVQPPRSVDTRKRLVARANTKKQVVEEEEGSRNNLDSTSCLTPLCTNKDGEAKVEESVDTNTAKVEESTETTNTTEKHPDDNLNDEEYLLQVLAQRSHLPEPDRAVTTPITQTSVHSSTSRADSVNVEYDERGRPTKRSLNASIHSSASEQPGAYVGAPGAEYGRLQSVHNVNAILSSSQTLNDTLSASQSSDQRLVTTEHESGEQATMLGEGNGDPESKQKSSFDASCYLMDDVTNESNTATSKKIGLIVCVATLLLIVTLALALPLALKQGSSDDTPDHGRGSFISHPEDIVRHTNHTLVPHIMDATIKAILEDPDSPQARAYDWISRDPDWNTYEDWRKQQRFALACAYYSFTGGAILYSFLNRFGYHFLECEWQSHADICPEGDGSVRRLRIGFPNDQKGYLPTEIAFLSHLEAIDFSKTKLNPSLEALLPLNTPNSLPALKELILSDTEKVGSIPSTLGLLTSLTHLDLSYNKLDSTIPSELGLLSNLTSLVLSSNKLSGTIPEEIGNLPYLTKLDVKGNPEMEASVPLDLCTTIHVPLEALVTDWCSGIDDCCP